jgi:deoxyribose-phosphate aldolase
MSASSDTLAWRAQVKQRAQEILAHPRDVPGAETVRLTVAQLAAMIDHTLLKPEATAAMVAKLCAEAQEYHFASVCVNPFHVAQCARVLTGTRVLTCSVAGFPLGANVASVKAFEARRAIEDGAQEVDMVLNVGALKAREYALVRDDVAAVAEVCHARQVHLKVILEACLLDDEEKVVACLLAVEAGADFVKTSTGLSTGGATVADVALMRRTVGPGVGVKAAGGIRTYEAAVALIAAGANRIGASAGIAILASLRA